MFYHQILLHRRGHFGLIWMEAMQNKACRITKREALEVNVRQTCEKILFYAYTRKRADPDQTVFSLYLSAHLMYGVVSIWRKQVQFLLDQAQEVKNRVGSEAGTIENIDLRHLPRLDQIICQDLIPKEIEENPFFGSLKHFHEKWDTFLQVEITPEWSPSKHRDQQAVSILEPEAGSPHVVSSKAQITMKELPYSTSPFLDVPVPGEKDLPMLNGEELEMTTEQLEDDLRLTLQDLMPDVQTASTGSPLLPQARPLSERGDRTPEKAAPEKVEGRERGEKKKRKRQAEDLDRTQMEDQTRPKRPGSEQDSSFELEPPPTDVVITPRRPRRTRRELFVDVDKEMPRSKIRHNLITSRTTCRQFELVSTRVKDTPAHLFHTPGSSSIARNPHFRRLWSRNCQSKETESADKIYWVLPVDKDRYVKYPRAKRDESSSVEVSSQDEARVQPDVERPVEDVLVDTEQVMTGTPSMETVREGSLSRSRTSQHSSLHVPTARSPMEESLSSTGSKGQPDRSREGARRANSTEGGSLSGAEEPSLSSLGTSARLGVLPEEMEELYLSPPGMPRLPEYSPSSPQIKFVSRCKVEGADTYTTFRAMCPPKTNTRPDAAKCFIALLEQCSQGSLFVLQRKPYGDIYISTSHQTLPSVPS